MSKKYPSPEADFGARENQINAYRISERSMSNAKLMLLVQSKPLRQHGQDVMNGVSYGEAQNLVFPRAEGGKGDLQTSEACAQRSEGESKMENMAFSHIR